MFLFLVVLIACIVFFLKLNEEDSLKEKNNNEVQAIDQKIKLYKEENSKIEKNFGNLFKIFQILKTVLLI